MIVATLVQQGIQDEQGDLFEPVRNGVLAWNDIEDLSALVTGKTPGRRSDKDITLFKQNSDQGVGYMALARLVHDKAPGRGHRDGVLNALDRRRYLLLASFGTVLCVTCLRFGGVSFSIRVGVLDSLGRGNYG